MNWILALFAFAGIMAVMSTIASVVVEAIHKVFALRGGGMQEMLRALHDGVVMPLDPEYPDVTEGTDGGSSREASKFAKQMTRSPAYGGKGRWWWIANIPFLNVFTRRFENLSKLQFVEQLTQTDYGQRLSSMNRPQVKQSLNRLVYEFDRYGAGQSEYFGARAKVFTTIVALLIVSLGNLNALSIYSHLATNQGALSGVLNTFNSEEALNGFIAQKVTEATLAQQDTGATTGLASTISSDFRILSNAGFPVGRDFFPYCDNPSNANCDVKGFTESVNLFGVYESAAIPRILTPEGGQWLVGMIATAGLIGLGANFWFNLFKAMASFALRNASAGVGGVRSRNPVPSSVVSDGEVRRPREIKGSLASPGAEPDLDLLTDAFLTVAGKDVTNVSTGEFGSRGGSSLEQASPIIPKAGVYVGEMPTRNGPPPRKDTQSGIRKYRG
ncbi:hypothetical protein [Hirschia maritima]|uniref:hypothetical protein n=1 Tax=Hirschia maritima TaxID=1121961 RepID=UPI00036F5404|nr:hypothetical protein [Hirschia maritima]